MRPKSGDCLAQCSLPWLHCFLAQRLPVAFPTRDNRTLRRSFALLPSLSISSERLQCFAFSFPHTPPLRLLPSNLQCCVCKKCGSILSPTLEPPSAVSKKRLWTCRYCDTRKHVEMIAVPYVFRYLVAEMYAMNMRIALDVN